MNMLSWTPAAIGFRNYDNQMQNKDCVTKHSMCKLECVDSVKDVDVDEKCNIKDWNKFQEIPRYDV